jgi:hypothetical protein
MLCENREMKMRAVLPVLWLLCLPSLACAQASDAHHPPINVTNIHGAVTATSATIVNYYVDEAPPGSTYETGSLHIV